MANFRKLAELIYRVNPGKQPSYNFYVFSSKMKILKFPRIQPNVNSFSLRYFILPKSKILSRLNAILYNSWYFMILMTADNS